MIRGKRSEEDHYYAQRGEDRTIAGFLAAPLKDRGFYIDVGAWHPEIDSVTKFFYDRGWSGINVEPIPYYYEQLLAERPRDINLPIAVGEKQVSRSFTWIKDTGLSTFHRDNAERGSQGREVEHIQVTISPLSLICRNFVRPEQEIDFLKVDVEGWEGEVLRSGDWERYRPHILCIEATVPNTETPAWEDWEDFVLSQDYQFLDFDGLNRFYRDLCRG